tara:strand:- start:1138 stop:1287 length:150 start_codon:yes stop_codon:yes gene_type:complete
MDSVKFEVKVVDKQQRPYKVYDDAGNLVASTRTKEQAVKIIAIRERIAS